MKGLAAFIMQGPVQAAGVTAATLLLGYVLPPFAWLSAGAVALVTLRLGDGALLRMGLPALGVVALVGMVVSGRPGVVVIGALAAWLPAMLAARVLRGRGRLDDALLVACGIGFLVVLGMHVAIADPTAWWQGLLETVLDPERLAAQMEMPPDTWRQLIERVAPLMTGFLGASLAFSTIASVLLGRWWHSLLDHPGGFQREFHALRLGRVAATVTVALCGLALATPAALLDGLALVAVTLYVFQGIAVLHGLIERRGLARGWLVGFYIIAILLPLQVMVGLTLVGVIDAWVDFRAPRVADR